LVAATPVYRLIVEDVRTQITNGVLKPGQKLPSITALAAQYECSQTQVKTAIAILRELGLVEGRQGVGTFVKAP
jgi:DNA-binding GntR family transcriptional regulator